MADKEAAYGLKGVNDPVAIRGELVFKHDHFKHESL
jgi:hypothetical protein